jgi:hypothetical protein
LEAVTLAAGPADILIVVPDLVAGADAVAGTGDEDFAVAAFGTDSLAGAVVLSVNGIRGDGWE